MELTGHIHNGVVVFDGGNVLPEGTRVKVEVSSDQTIRNRPYLNEEGKLVLTNEMIADILMEEDIQAITDQWNATPRH